MQTMQTKSKLVVYKINSSRFFLKKCRSNFMQEWSGNIHPLHLTISDDTNVSKWNFSPRSCLNNKRSSHQIHVAFICFILSHINLSLQVPGSCGCNLNRQTDGQMNWSSKRNVSQTLNKLSFSVVLSYVAQAQFMSSPLFVFLYSVIFNV